MNRLYDIIRKQITTFAVFVLFSGFSLAYAQNSKMVKIQIIEPENVKIFNSYEGFLEPYERVTVRSETAGTIEKINFEEGKEVKKNQVLVHVSTERLALQEKLQNSNYKLAESEYKSQQQLFDRNVTTASILNNYINKRDVSKIQLQLAQLNLEKSKVKSPITGIVKSQLVQTGETVNAQKNLLEIMNIRKVLAKINIPENDMIFINPGKEVTIRLDSIAGETFEGVVKTLGLEADLNTHKFPAEIAIDNPNSRLFPEMVARVEMMTVYMENQILIPRSAVMNSQGRKTVFVEKASKVTRRKVTLGMTIKNRVQVLSGLKINDKLIIFGQDKLSEGDMVAISH